MMDTCAMRYLLGLLALLLVSCTHLPATDTPPPFDPPTPMLTPAPSPEPTTPPTEPAPGQWFSLWPGAELLTTEDGLIAFRHQPEAARYSAAFESNPDENHTVSRWLEADANALVAVNCGFYRSDKGTLNHIGLLTTNEQLLSPMRPRWGGVLIVRNGVAFAVRRPQRLLAPASLGIQGWPMLVENGAVIPRLNDTDRARRTAVGVDASGRAIWVVAPGSVTLAQFAYRLRERDLDLIDAVNLDGGASTGLRWRADVGGAQVGPDSLAIPCSLRFSEP